MSGGVRGGTSAKRGAVVGACAAALASPFVGIAALHANEEAPRFETFSGAELNGNAAVGYLGLGWAPGKSLYEQGFRLRAVGAFGGYEYDGTLSGVAITFDGSVGYGELAAGYLFREGPLTLKLFAGVAVIDHHISPHDPSNAVQGTKAGVLLKLEAWRDLSATKFLSIDGSYTNAFGQYWSRIRYGCRLSSKLAVGLEGGIIGNEEYDAAKGGGFLRLYFDRTEITVGGGITGDYLESQTSPYLSLGVHRAF